MKKQVKNPGLMMRMIQPWWGSYCIVVTDSKFCFMRGIYELLLRGLFAISTIKKKQYWPRHIPGQEIEDHLQGQPVGTVVCRPGTIRLMQNTTLHPFHLLCTVFFFLYFCCFFINRFESIIKVCVSPHPIPHLSLGIDPLQQ